MTVCYYILKYKYITTWSFFIFVKIDKLIKLFFFILRNSFLLCFSACGMNMNVIWWLSLCIIYSVVRFFLYFWFWIFIFFMRKHIMVIYNFNIIWFDKKNKMNIEHITFCNYNFSRYSWISSLFVFPLLSLCNGVMFYCIVELNIYIINITLKLNVRAEWSCQIQLMIELRWICVYLFCYKNNFAISVEFSSTIQKTFINRISR